MPEWELRSSQDPEELKRERARREGVWKHGENYHIEQEKQAYGEYYAVRTSLSSKGL